MRSYSVDLISGVYWLFLPMRGYEVYAIKCGSYRARLFLPMRGYESKTSLISEGEPLVISPHEGLWAGIGRSGHQLYDGYFSPWGVMSVSGWELWPDYTSYFSPWGVMRTLFHRIHNRRRRYFSPWGVMSRSFRALNNVVLELFLPMRGYEVEGAQPLSVIFKLFLPMRGYEMGLPPPDADQR